jgi:hypothetical protein
MRIPMPPTLYGEIGDMGIKSYIWGINIFENFRRG